MSASSDCGQRSWERGGACGRATSRSLGQRWGWAPTQLFQAHYRSLTATTRIANITSHQEAEEPAQPPAVNEVVKSQDIATMRKSMGTVGLGKGHHPSPAYMYTAPPAAETHSSLLALPPLPP